MLSRLSASRGLKIASLTVGFSLIAIAITWPLATHLDTHLIGRTTDAYVHYWNNWWVQKALATGQSPFFTPYLNYPYGVSLVAHNFAWLNILPWLLLEPLLGGIVAYNLILMGSLVLCGLAMWWLVHDQIGSPLAAFLAGVVYMAWPLRLSQLDHPNLVGTYCIPLFLLFLGRVLRSHRWRDAIFMGMAIGLVGYGRWQTLIPAFFMGLIFLLGHVPKGWPAIKQAAPRVLVGVAIGALMLLPPLLMLLNAPVDVTFGEGEGYSAEEIAMSVDWFAAVTPSPQHTLLKEITNPLYDGYYADRSSGQRYPAYIGLSVLLLALVGLVARWRKTWPWLLMALTLMLLAAGPFLRVGGQTFDSLPTLYDALSPLGIVQLMRDPERYWFFVALPMAMLAANGWLVVLTHLSRRWVRVVATFLLALVVLFEYSAVPARMIDAQHTPVTEQLAAADDSSAVLNLPLRYRFSKDEMFAQTRHERPILQGHVSREPDNLYQFIAENEWFDDILPLPNEGFTMAQLAQAGVGHVVVPKTCNEDDAALCDWPIHLISDPVFEDDRQAAYATRPSFVIQHPLTSSLGIVEATTVSLCSDHRIFVVATVTWATTAEMTEDAFVQLQASAESQTFTSARYALSRQWPTSQWPAGTLTRDVYTLTMPARAAADSLTLRLVDADSNSTATLPLDTPRCDIATAETTNMQIGLGRTLTLMEYGFDHDGTNLTVSPVWYANERPRRYYQFFVHVVEPLTNNIVAQVDSVPEDWNFPTTLWPKGQLLVDELTVDLSDVPLGIYEVVIGVVDTASAERLPILAGSRRIETLPDHRLVLSQRLFVTERPSDATN